ncbi:MAG: hypothetical protein Q9209_005916 [Squamulea sp. 1 TL-2023]
MVATLLFLVCQLDRGRIPVHEVQDILATWGTRSSPAGAHTRRRQDIDRGDVDPIPCHAHNDYEQPLPLYNALNAGCISVEADIWLQDGDLLIGHEENSLELSRTLGSLYLEPLVSILKDRNSNRNFNDGADRSGSLKGVYPASSSISLTLLIDVKTDSADTLPVLMDQLSSLRTQGLLTYFDGISLMQGPITVVATGNTNFDTILEKKDRAIFFDAPLDHRWSHDSPTDVKSYTKGNSYYASASFEKAIGKPSLLGDLSNEQMEKIREHIKGAHDKGLKVRYWDTPGWPNREKIWDMLWKEGVDVLNVDELKEAKEFLARM